MQVVIHVQRLIGVNLSFALLFKVVQCTGCMKMSTKVSETGEEEQIPLFMVAVGVPLMFSSTFEVPLDRATFTSRHNLDMNFLSCDERFVAYSTCSSITKTCKNDWIFQLIILLVTLFWTMYLKESLSTSVLCGR